MTANPSPSADPVARLQETFIKAGRWLDQAEAQDLYAQVANGDLPEDRFVDEAMTRSRPLTDDERRKLAAAGVRVDA